MRPRQPIPFVDEDVRDRAIGLEVGDELVESWSIKLRTRDAVIDVEVADVARPVRSASATSAASTASGTFTSRDRFIATSY